MEIVCHTILYLVATINLVKDLFISYLYSWRLKIAQNILTFTKVFTFNITIMLKKTYLFLFSLFTTVTVFAQNSTLVFLSDEDVSIVVYRPIDNCYNEDYPTDTLRLQAHQSFEYQLNVDDWAVVKCLIPSKANLNIFVEKGCSTILKNAEKGVAFEGCNAVGNELLNKNIFNKFYFIRAQLDSAYQKKDDGESYKQLVSNSASLLKKFGLQKSIDSIYAKKEISEACYNYLIDDCNYKIKYYLANRYKPSPVIADCLYEMIKATPNTGKEAYYSCGIAYISHVSAYVYDHLSQQTKDSLRQKYGKETFGPYMKFILTSGKIQLNSLFTALLLQYLYGVNEFDRVKMYTYLQEHYPNSESVKIIERYIAEELNDKTPVNPIYIDGQSINSFPDIEENDSFKNKYVLVDLWASWCMPCRAEFIHNKALNSLLSKYKDVEKLYISIDENVANWKETINSQKLAGYHTLANKQLQEYLKKNVYSSNAITIPRYILLNPNGEIVDGNLPRPSSMDELKKALDKYLHPNKK